MDGQLRREAVIYASVYGVLFCLLGLSEFASLRPRYEPAPVLEDSAAMRLRRDLDRENEAIPGESEIERVLRNLEADVAVADAKLKSLKADYEALPPLDGVTNVFFKVVPNSANTGAAARVIAAAKVEPVPTFVASAPVRSKVDLPSKPVRSELVFARPAFENTGEQTCGNAEVRTEIEMKKLYKGNEFKDPDGGIWTQGFDIEVDENKWKGEKLKVWVIPHSHNDPGWIKTVDEYFNKATRKILSNMVVALMADPTRTFIWAEISYLSMWWETIDDHTKNSVRSLIKTKQLEIVAGGWVMPDEANTHYFAIIDQLIEGHQWLEKNLGVKPEFGWAIDPFGHSPTMAYIMKQSGYKGMLIQRTHYEVKRMLAQRQSLEFGWRQDWDSSNSTDMFTHMMPFYSYDVPHTCGPDPSICCQFDFARMRGVAKYRCPWKKPPQPITASNVQVRAEMLLNQYKKKASLYRTNSLLIPLGDDFRWDTSKESDAQFNNYATLFNYINSRADLNTQIRFGTLSDYFHSVWEESTKAAPAAYPPGGVPPGFPTLTGDFFTYADRKDNYWSGYYTSRPFYKHFDRELEAGIRASEILFSLTDKQFTGRGPIFEGLEWNRRELGVFQHHDGITGTAKDAVVVDYAKRMLRAITGASEASIQSIRGILGISSSLEAETTRVSYNELPRRKLVALTGSQGTQVVFHNSLAAERVEYVSLVVDSTKAEVRGPDGSTVNAQAVPRLDSVDVELWFQITIPALGLAVYTVVEAAEAIGHTTSVKVLNYQGAMSADFTEKTDSIPDDQFCTPTGASTVCFSTHTGLLTNIMHTGGLAQVNVKFKTYGSTTGKDKSGAYLFMPDGEAHDYSFTGKPRILVADGPLMMQVSVMMDRLTHVARVFKTGVGAAAAIRLDNEVDISSKSLNYELVMRLETGVQHNRVYHTDLNGFQMMRRETLDKLPMGGNFFPLPSMAILEDPVQRITLNSRSSHGCAALKQGWFEVVLDRRLLQDDKRGLFQKIMDNIRTRSSFSLLLQLKANPDATVLQDGIPSATETSANDQLNYPIQAFASTAQLGADVSRTLEPLAHELPCDIHLVNLRSLDRVSQETALLLHRRPTSCATWKDQRPCTSPGSVDLLETFKPKLAPAAVKAYSLTMMHPDVSEKSTNSAVSLAPRELYAWKLYADADVLSHLTE